MVLVVNNLGDHQVFEIADDLLLALAQRGLIGDLVEIAGGLGAFTVQAAYRQAHFLGGTEHLFDLAGELESRQVEHDTDADAGADVGGAGGEVAKARADRKSTRLNSSHVKISYAVFCL